MQATKVHGMWGVAFAAVCVLGNQAWAGHCRDIERLARTAWDHVDELDLEFDRNFRPASEQRMLLNTTDRMLDLLEDIEDDAACGGKVTRMECRIREAIRLNRVLQITVKRMDARYGHCRDGWQGCRPYRSERAHALLCGIDVLLGQLERSIECLGACDMPPHRPPHQLLPAPTPPACVPPAGLYRHGDSRHGMPGPRFDDDRFGVNFGVNHGRPVISFGNGHFAISIGG